MDAITILAASVNEPLLRSIGLLLDDNIIYGLVIVALLLIGERRLGKITKVMLALALALLLATGLKNLIAEERPCAGQDWCPHDFAFPSLHATAAFTLMIAFLNKRSYPAYLAFALFVCFTRLNLGMHDFQDIAGALPVALISYYLVDILWRSGAVKGGKKDGF
ncbi:phosphatase PAP2 family protein [Candidatus Micrarchaeota archaeon]|nr:phosphatase PAP2 family protein [Candidatus Micrarchaeota archaeon]